jgi:arsenite methyltransferase
MWLRAIAFPALAIGLTFVVQALIMIWGSKVGKLRFRDKVLDRISWRGDELVLDVGCGHGLMLIGAAKKLRSGKAIGVDIWQTEDQAGNSAEATWKNVHLEGVDDRVELKDADARKLPFEDNAFDVVLSSWALHNIYDETGRKTALREIARVLKPGGRLVIVDIQHTKEYAVVLQDSGLLRAERFGPSFLFVIPSYTVMATKASGTTQST